MQIDLRTNIKNLWLLRIIMSTRMQGSNEDSQWYITLHFLPVSILGANIFYFPYLNYCPSSGVH